MPHLEIERAIFESEVNGLMDEGGDGVFGLWRGGVVGVGGFCDVGSEDSGGSGGGGAEEAHKGSHEPHAGLLIVEFVGSLTVLCCGMQLA